VTELPEGVEDYAWSPDGTQIAYVTKRGTDPDRHLNFDIYLIEPRAGAVERQLTRFEGTDLNPEWETRPAWSPDGKRIAYLQGGEDKWVYYAPARLAVVDVASGKETWPRISIGGSPSRAGLGTVAASTRWWRRAASRTSRR